MGGLHEHSKLEERVVQMIGDMGQQSSRSMEQSISSFTNGLRAQFDTMQSAQVAHRLEFEASITSKMDKKLDGVMSGLQQQSMQTAKKQADEVTSAVESCIKNFTDQTLKTQQERFEDFKSYLNDTTHNQ